VTLFTLTSMGIARETPDGLALLETSYASIGQAIRNNDLAGLEGCATGQTLSWDEAELLAPVRRPGKVVIVGLNYRDHARETGIALPSSPRFHLVAGSAVTASGARVTIPSVAPHQVDYEGELAIVIGAAGADIQKRNAWNHIAGATAANDISARDVQLGKNSALGMASPSIAKSFDGFKPLGPALMTTDELRERLPLRITTEVNGEVRQHSATSEMVFPIPELIAFISRYLVLEPGDVILTGTPGGIGMTTENYLRPGDTVDVIIDGIGRLRNRLVEQPVKP
jgi:2-keto-4-pentenoate hydratase/2-oxohepta-3-ene-1,7-dioic acid hydratase in catechol pathway